MCELMFTIAEHGFEIVSRLDVSHSALISFLARHRLHLYCTTDKIKASNIVATIGSFPT